MDRRQFLLAAAAAPLAPRRLPGRQAYVTADLESHVAVVDVDRGAVVRRIPTAPGPRAIERIGPYAVVAHTVAGKVSILRDGEVVHELDGFAEPRYACAPGFVTDSGEPQLVQLDLERGRIVRRIRLKQWPRHLTRRGDAIVVALGTASSEIAIVRNGGVTYRRRANRVHDVGFSPRGQLWLPPALPDPQHVTFRGGRVYVTDGARGRLRIYDEERRLLRTLAIPVGSYNVQSGAGLVVTPSLARGTLTVVGGDVIQVARSSHDACLMP